MDTLSAILKEDPPDLSTMNRALPPALERVVRHCLEKNPEERFQSAQDLAFDLESLSGSAIQAPVAAPARPSRRRWLAVGAAVAPLALLAVGLFLGQRMSQKSPPTLQQLTFRRGTIRSARFAPDGQTIVYSARWESNPVELFTTRPESPESRSLGNLKGHILAISSSGEMAVQLQSRILGGFRVAGTLARAPLAGGAPRDVLEVADQRVALDHVGARGQVLVDCADDRGPGARDRPGRVEQVEGPGASQRRAVGLEHVGVRQRPLHQHPTLSGEEAAHAPDRPRANRARRDVLE